MLSVFLFSSLQFLYCACILILLLILVMITKPRAREINIQGFFPLHSRVLIKSLDGKKPRVNFKQSEPKVPILNSNLGKLYYYTCILIGPCYSHYLEFSFGLNCVRLNAPNPESISEQLGAFLHSKQKKRFALVYEVMLKP